MKTHEIRGIDRRLAIGGGLAAAAGLAWPRSQIRGRVVTQRGIAGGGVVQLEGGEAHFSLFASSLTFDEGQGESEETFLGGIVWSDSALGLTLESTRLTDYENTNTPGAEGESRRIRGMMTTGDAGEQPFVIDVLDAGGPGLGADRITLAVGDTAGVGDAATPEPGLGFSYVADGVLISGDVHDVDFTVDVDTGEVGEAPPAT